MAQTATAPRAKGPLVWMNMDQRELDDAYDQMVYAPNRDQVHKRNMFNSDRVRARLGAPKRMAYGPTPIEALDLFPAKTPNAPINVFIHGGAWRQRTAADYAFLAEMFVRAGAHFIALDFVGVEHTKGDLMPMADQVRRAVAWVYQNAKSFGGDPERIYISSQSSGAHLGGNVVTTDWSKYGVPANVVKGALLCSGMYDLKPVRLSKRSEYVAFTDQSGGGAVVDPPSRPAQLPADRRARHVRDAGVPAPGARLRRRREGRRQAGHAAGRRGLQPFRDGRDDRQSAEPPGQRGAGADEIESA